LDFVIDITIDHRTVLGTGALDEPRALVRFRLGELQGLFVCGVDFYELAVVEFFQPVGDPGQLMFELFLPLAHAGFPLAVGFTECFSEALTLDGLLVPDFLVHVGELPGGFLFGGNFQQPRGFEGFRGAADGRH